MWVIGQRERKRADERAAERSLVAAFDGSSVLRNQDSRARSLSLRNTSDPVSSATAQRFEIAQVRP